MLAIAALSLTGLAARLIQVQGVDAARYASYGAQEVYQRIALPSLAELSTTATETCSRPRPLVSTSSPTTSW